MNTNLVFGALALIFGLVTLVARFVAPDDPRLFKKLEPMKEAWGERAGLVIHVLAYTVVPLVVGAGMLAAGLLDA